MGTIYNKWNWCRWNTVSDNGSAQVAENGPRHQPTERTGSCYRYLFWNITFVLNEALPGTNGTFRRVIEGNLWRNWITFVVEKGAESFLLLALDLDCSWQRLWSDQFLRWTATRWWCSASSYESMSRLFANKQCHCQRKPCIFKITATYSRLFTLITQACLAAQRPLKTHQAYLNHWRGCSSDPLQARYEQKRPAN